MSVLSVAIGRAAQPAADDLEVVRLGALLHDIGKIGVPDDVLRKPEPLTASEYDTIKQHPVLGARMLRIGAVPRAATSRSSSCTTSGRTARATRTGLRGDDIPLDARIVHVADAYDAMTSARAYRPGRRRRRGAARAVALRRHGIPRRDRRCAGDRAAGPRRPRVPRYRIDGGGLLRSRACRATLAVLVIAGWPPVRCVGAVGAACQRSTARSASTISSAQNAPADRPDIIIDVTAAVRLGKGWVAYVRPWFRTGVVSDPHDCRQGNLSGGAPVSSGADAISTRVDLGYILSPIGLGMLDMRPDTNPTIMPHLSYLMPMPAFDPGVPVVAADRVVVSARRAGDGFDDEMGRARGGRERAAESRRSCSTPLAQSASRPTLVVGGGVTPRRDCGSGWRSRPGNYATAQRADADRAVRRSPADDAVARGRVRVWLHEGSPGGDPRLARHRDVGTAPRRMVSAGHAVA